MSSVMPFAFNAAKLCVATINEKPWIRAKEACMTLEYKKGRTGDVLKKHVSIESKQHKHELEGRAIAARLLEWPKNRQPDDYYINEEGMYELGFGSQQPKKKDFRKHCFNVLFAHVRQQITNKMNQEHQQAIEEKDNQIQTHQHKISKLNEETDDLIKNGHVARRGYFDNVLCFIKKNSKEAHPYYVIRYQYRQLEKYKKCLKLRYPNMEEAGRCDDPNAIHRWSIFKSEVIEKPNYYKTISA